MNSAPFADTRRAVFDLAAGALREPLEPALVGFKAANLARMIRMGLPVPEGFVIGTPWCARHFGDRDATRAELEGVLQDRIRGIEHASGRVFGDARRPLLVSVRSGAPVSMPGMMDTLLNVGLCDTTVRGLLRTTGNPRLVWDSYRRLIQQFAEVVFGADPAPFERRIDEVLREQAIARVQELDFRTHARLAQDFLALFEHTARRRFPQQPAEQLALAVGAVFDSWHSERARRYRAMNDVSEKLGTAVTVQRMVFGNAGGTSGSGVGFSRDPATGAATRYVDFLFNSQGEDVVSGRHDAADAHRLSLVLPDVARELEDVAARLEQEFRDAQEYEFTVQDGTLFLLQTRTAKRTPLAALRMAVEMVEEGRIEPHEALARLNGLDLEALRLRRVQPGANDARIATAVAACPGAASGAIALDASAAAHFAADGRRVILVRDDTATDDIAALAGCAGLLTRQGSRTSHAAVIARQMGKVALVGCTELAIDPARRTIRLGGLTLAEGDTLSLDGNDGVIYHGSVEIAEERPEAWLREVARWRAR